MLSPLLAALASAEASGVRVEAYGSLRVDAILDDSRTDNVQKPLFVQSEAPGDANDARFSLHPRLTRLGLDAASGAMSSKLEIDFQNGPSSESRQMLRIRHAYLQARGGGLGALAGQTWDVIAPLLPSASGDTLLWNAGNLGDRRPQARATLTHAWLTGASIDAALAATMVGAVEGRDADMDGVPDGEDAGVPGVQARVGVRAGGFALGIGALSSLSSASDAEGAAIDVAFEPHWRVALRGEAFAGRDLADVRGGIGQGVTAAGEPVHAAGGWVELPVRPLRTWTVAPGFSIDDPDDADLAAGMRARNVVTYLAQMVDLGGGTRVGAEVLRWTTDWVDLPRGTDNRVNLWISHAP